MDQAHPIRFAVDYPDRQLNRLTTFFRIFTVIPIAIVLASVAGYITEIGTAGAETTTVVVGGTGLLFLPPLLMILFREKYPRWWYDFNLRAAAVPQPRRGLRRADGRPLPLDRRAQAVHLELPVPRRAAGSTAGCRW